MTRNFHEASRSVAYSTEGMVATSHPLASMAARDCLKNGGNAVDAAIVASAVLCVVEPQSTGIGGDCFALVKPSGKKIIGFNGSGYAGSKANADALRAQGLTEILADSAQAVTVPGAIDAWDQLLNDYGTISLSEALKPAQKLAEQGFVILPRVALDWSSVVDRLNKDVGARAHLLIEGQAPKAGCFYKFPALAATLQKLIEQGRDGFYTGEIAEDIIATLNSKDGLLTMDDLESYKGQYVEPISGMYKGHKIYEIPPNGHGITALILLNILAKFDMSGLEADSAERYHLHMEATRFAYALRDKYVADPQYADVPVDALLSDELATQIAEQINLDKKVDAHILPDLPMSDTIYLTVADDAGNVISFINSTFEHFGTGIVTVKTGIALQCRGAGFSLEKGHPNEIEAGKRPMHTIIPAMVEKDGALLFSFGVMGGAYQPCGHAFFLSNIIDYGMDIQQSIDFPRIFMKGSKLGVEKRVSEDVCEGLKNKGHILFEVDMPWGGAQAIKVYNTKGDETLYTGASDSRKDGVAIGL
ncbi:MAG: gamma-glutamyltransferase [Rhizobiales bacterium]|nr:gamma-glutamyltransferase [Hyphomicrobiales bacterium]